HDTLGREDHDQDCHHADDQRMVLPVGRYNLTHDNEDARADHRPEQSASAAHDCPNDAVTRHVVEHVGRRGITTEECEQHTCDAGKKSGHHKRYQTQEIDVETN